MKMIKSLTVTLLTSLLMASFAVAQEEAPLLFSNEVFMEVEEVDAEGNINIVLEPATTVLPGEIVTYVSTVTHRGDENVDGVVINNPIPANTNYVAFTATGEGTEITFSIDGGQSFGAPQELEVTDENGVSSTAAAEDYTDIRWTFLNELTPGDSASVSFKARLQ